MSFTTASPLIKKPPLVSFGVGNKYSGSGTKNNGILKRCLITTISHVYYYLQIRIIYVRLFRVLQQATSLKG